MKNIKQINHIIIILVVLFSSNYSISAQNYFYKEYNEEDGLPSGNVFDSVQDTLGRMWFATRNGIVSYDASRWNYFENTKIFDQTIFVKLQLDAQGTIWAINESKISSLFYYQNEEWHRYKLPKNLEGRLKIVNQFKVDTRNNDTLITFCRYINDVTIYNKGVWKYFSLNDFDEEVQIFSMELLEDKLLICTSKGIFSYDRKTSQFSENYEKEFGLDFFPFAIKKNNNSQNSFTAYGKIKLVKIENNKPILLLNTHLFSKTNRERFYLLPEYFGKIFFGNIETVYEFDVNTGMLKEHLNDSKLGQIGPTSFFIDYENNLWITGLRGLLKQQTPFVNIFNQKNGLFKDEVTSVIETDGKIYLGHENGITIFDGKEFTRISFNQKNDVYRNNRILDICLDSNKNVWFAASNIGFGRINKSTKAITWYKPDNDANLAGSSLLITKDGKLLAANSTKIYEFDGKEFKIKYNIGEVYKVSPRKLFLNKKGELIIATSSKGLMLLKENSEPKFYQSTRGTSANSIYSFYEDEKHNFVGTAEGLFIISEDSLKKVEGEFRINRPIYFITKDNSGHFWFGTDNGVFVSIKNGYFHLSPRNGLLGYETNRDAGFVDSEGKIWVGTDKGVSTFDNKFMYAFENITPRILALIKEDDKYVPLNEQINREHDFRNVELYISTVSFIDEYNNKVNYKLSGINDELKTIDRNEGPYITFYNLGSGSYNFQAVAVNSIQLKSDTPITADIIIDEPFYSEWWFFTVLAILFFPFLYIAVRYFERRRQAQRLEEEVNKRTFQLSDSEKRYRNLLNRIQDAVFVIQDSKLTVVNEAFLKITGYPFEEAIGSEFSKFIAPEDIELVKERYKKRQAGELVPADYEIRLLHKNGFSRIYVNMHVGAFDYEGKMTTIGTLKDITAAKLSQEKIIKSEARLRALTNMLPDMMFELDENGYLVDYHLPENSPLSIHPLKLVGKNIEDFLPRSLQRIGMRLIKTALDTGKIQVREIFLNNNNKKYFYEVRVIVSSERKALVIIRDISERKESEKQLIEAKEQAEQSDKLKSEFLAQVSHEIRTPINTILNFASLIKEDCADKVNEDLKDSFSVIENGGRRLIRTIDLILNMSQIQTGAYKPNIKLLNLDDDILSSVYSELKSFAESKNLTLNYEIENSIKKIYGDSYTLGQIFINLIDNAVKYTPSGTIKIKSFTNETHICVEVSDTGIGISKEFLPSLFSPFSQEETGYTRKFEGTGLGLALVKNYVMLNNGEITVSSKKGNGTTFTVKFLKA